MATEITPPQLLDGFGFLEGELIGGAPMVFPGEQQLFMLLEITAQYAGELGPIGTIVAVVAEIIVLILQLIDFLVGLFSGKPRSQDTLTVAGRFARGKSPIAHLQAVLIHRNLSQNNIVLSDSDPAAQKILGHIRTQGAKLLEALGTDPTRAVHVIDQVWYKTTAPDEKLPPELDQPIPPEYVLIGPQTLQQEYINHYNHFVKQGDSPIKAAKLATNWIYNNAQLGDLGKIEIRFMPQSDPHGCRVGTHWDEASQSCVPDIVTQPGDCKPPALPIIPPTWPQPPQIDPDGDELAAILPLLTYWTQIMALSVFQIDEQVSDIVGGQGGGGNSDPVTCKQLGEQVQIFVTAFTKITEAIGAITVNNAITIDTAPVAEVVDRLVSALDKLIGNDPVDISHLNAQADSQKGARDASVSSHDLMLARIRADLANLQQALT